MLKVTNNEVYLTRGDNALLHISARDSTGSTYVPQDGDVVTLSVKKKVKDNDKLICKIQDIHTETGWDITINPEDTSALSFGDYVYDVQLVGSNGWVDTIIEPSTFTIGEEVTT